VAGFKERPYKILCVNCRTHLFNYSGSFVGRFDSESFKPATSGIPAPKKHARMECPKCKKAWYMVTYRNGKLVVMTDRGWRPKDPDGPSRILLPEDVRLTVDYQASDLDYTEPTGR